MKKSVGFIVLMVLLLFCFAFAACTNTDNKTVSDEAAIANLQTDVSNAFDKVTYVTDLMIDRERGVIAFSVENEKTEIALSDIKLSSGSFTVASVDGTVLSALALKPPARRCL